MFPLLHLTDRLCVFPAQSSPLSADIGVIRGDRFTYLYDVGASAEALAFLGSLPGEKQVVLSHFHRDHTLNLPHVSFASVWGGRESLRHVPKPLRDPLREHPVTQPVTFCDGVRLTIGPMPSSHASGCVCLTVEDTYTFLGDAFYPGTKDGRPCYNAQLLARGIDTLRALPGRYVILSHRQPLVCEREALLRCLSAIERRPLTDGHLLFV